MPGLRGPAFICNNPPQSLWYWLLCLRKGFGFIVTLSNDCLWSLWSILSLDRQAHWVSKENLTVSKLFFWTVGQVPPGQVPYFSVTLVREIWKSDLSFTAAPELLRYFFCCFCSSSSFWEGFGLQLSCQSTPETSQGSLKAGGQRPLTSPAMNAEGGLISSSADWSHWSKQQQQQQPTQDNISKNPSVQ